MSLSSASGSMETASSQETNAWPAGSEASVPSKKFKRIKREEVPLAFDLDQVNYSEVMYLPGGALRAAEGAQKNRARTFTGVAWSLGGELSVLPGDWILLPLCGGQDWWLIYSSGVTEMIIVSRGGGYLKITKPQFLTLTLDVRGTPPDDEV